MSTYLTIMKCENLLSSLEFQVRHFGSWILNEKFLVITNLEEIKLAIIDVTVEVARLLASHMGSDTKKSFLTLQDECQQHLKCIDVVNRFQESHTYHLDLFTRGVAGLETDVLIALRTEFTTRFWRFEFLLVTHIDGE